MTICQTCGLPLAQCDCPTGEKMRQNAANAGTALDVNESEWEWEAEELVESADCLEDALDGLYELGGEG
jgi:hypothetical protein